MSAELDLDDVAATSAKARRELDEVRAENERLKSRPQMEMPPIPPMPPGVESMSKEQLWAWFSRTTTALENLRESRRSFWTLTTGLHQCHADRGLPSAEQTIALQQKKIAGLSLQMRQMHSGYRRKIARLEAMLRGETPFKP